MKYKKSCTKKNKRTRKKRGGTIRPRFGGVGTPLTHFVVRAIGDRDNGPINDFLGSIRNRQTEGYFLENDDSLEEDRVENFAEELEVMAVDQAYIGGWFLITYDTSNHDNFKGYEGGIGFFNYQHTRNIPVLQEFIASTSNNIPNDNIFPSPPIELFAQVDTGDIGNQSPISVMAIDDVQEGPGDEDEDEDEYDNYEQTMGSIAQNTSPDDDLMEIGGGKRRKKKTRKYKGNKYPYKNITKKEAIADFIKLKTTTNPRSLNGLEIVNYGTEKLRVRTKYRGKSLIQRWKDKKARKTLKKFANRLYKGSYTDDLLHAYRSAIALSWGTLSSMRTSAALQMYRKYNAKKVLDFTAGWGSRMTAALAADIDYIGIDTNKSLKKGYNKILKATKKHTKSKVKLFFKPAETVDYSKLDYDFVFTSPPYEYLELYEHMKNYEGTKKIKQAHSANDKRRKNDGFYDTFLIPTIKDIYKHLPKGKWMCLNVPDLMYDKIKKKWKACNKKEDYMISKRVGSNMKSDDRRGQEFVYCWKK